MPNGKMGYTRGQTYKYETYLLFPEEKGSSGYYNVLSVAIDSIITSDFLEFLCSADVH